MSGVARTDEPVENSQVDVYISEDGKKAFVSITEPKNGGVPASAQLISDSLARAGVVHGIDENAIASLALKPRYNYKAPVAAATLPENGQNSKITYLFPITSENKPKVLPNGSVDFKQLDLIKNIRQGEALCSKTPHTEGKPGIDVTGAPIEAQPGKDVAFPGGQNTYVSEDGLTLLAKIDGQVDLLNGRVTIMNVFNIKENVDYNTGNIDFVGNVTVGGDVSAGFTVKAGGNVHIKGCVDGGVVIAGGNVTVVNGFIGQSSGRIECGGDLRCKYLQNATADVGGSLEATSCVNSVVQVGKTAKFIGTQAMLLASKVVAGESVEALNIGSRSSKTPNVIEVGVNPRISDRLAALPLEINQTAKNIDNLNRVITLYNQLDAAGRLSQEKKDELGKLADTLRHAEINLESLIAEKAETEERVQSLGYGTIKVFGYAFIGTTISIGSEKKMLNSDYQCTQFTRTPEGISINTAQR